eukprot:CAMPEP_0179118446 /NCGR_PEP_ID=MMETSP0796-20121207/55703_1 /TAXON_ID=73915 /ORGANISM="Pyrodinium bahamense, Strain pbaha01" /LENGTH=96 /DNA_ID=CAMNT_0020816895 /DNA_START=54 /DNA_END=344 /DNA_ORIENTATION=+
MVGGGVPHLQLNIFSLGDLAEQDGLWPLPIVVEAKEFPDELARDAFWELSAHVGHHQRPRNPTKESEDVGIYPSPLGPVLHESQCVSEGLLIGHKL